jgi:hypothetical protein
MAQKKKLKNIIIFKINFFFFFFFFFDAGRRPSRACFSSNFLRRATLRSTKTEGYIDCSLWMHHTYSIFFFSSVYMCVSLNQSMILLYVGSSLCRSSIFTSKQNSHITHNLRFISHTYIYILHHRLDRDRYMMICMFRRAEKTYSDLIASIPHMLSRFNLVTER